MLLWRFFMHTLTVLVHPQRTERSTTGYLSHLIRSACGDGNQWNMRINCTQEMDPLEIIGPLSWLRSSSMSRFSFSMATC